jgi:mevalonate kinase
VERNETTIFTTRSHGKLLISGEYFVLHGAEALAVPLKFGQQMNVCEYEGEGVLWESFYKDERWFYARFSSELDVLETNSIPRANVVKSILAQGLKLSSKPILFQNGLHIQNILEFDPAWGWGSSSSLIVNTARWLNVDAFELSAITLGGSNYDVACAMADTPIIYQRFSGKYLSSPVSFYPSFHQQLYLVYLGEKQDSRLSVKRAGELKPNSALLDKISDLTHKIADASDFNQFVSLIEQHESIVAKLIHDVPVKHRLFSDFPGFIKSLGAWGGDFILAASTISHEKTVNYFQTKGYPVLFRYHDIVKS